jgi:hypothetical protein
MTRAWFAISDQHFAVRMLVCPAHCDICPHLQLTQSPGAGALLARTVILRGSPAKGVLDDCGGQFR